MKTVHRINKDDIFYSLKYLVWFIYATPIFLVLSIPFAHYIKGWDWDNSLEKAPLVFIISILFFILLPTIIIHISHYHSNKNLIVEIDKTEQKITFKKKREYTYQFSDLKAELCTPIYHKNKIDKARLWVTPWSNYSFLKVHSSDNKEFNISSTLIKPTEFPLEIKSTEYSLWPSIGPWFIDHEATKTKERELERSKLNDWKEKFSHLTVIQIEKKLNNADSLDYYPRKALIELKNEKTAT